MRVFVRLVFVRLVAALLLIIAGSTAHADGILGKLTDKLGGASSLLGGEAITTNIKDSESEIPYLDDFTPLQQQNASSLRLDEEGKLLITPGAHVWALQSYCLHAGTYGPTRGSGYGTAPLKGPKADLVRRILQKSPERPDIEQHEIQTLIWTIEAGVSFENMSAQMQRTLTEILAGKKKLPDPQDMRLLLDAKGKLTQAVAPKEQINDVLLKLNEVQRPLFLARNKVRQMNVMGGSFQELEQLAVLTGEPPKHKDDRDIPSSRWVYNEGSGVFLRFRPSGYSRTQVETYCPEKFFIRVDKEGRVREIENEDHSYTLQTLYDEAKTSTPQVTGLKLLHDGEAVFESKATSTLLPAIPHSATPRDGKDVLSPGVCAHLAELQEMKRNLIGKKQRALTDVMVDITNYRDGLAPALAALPDQDARMVLSDFVTRAWIATAYQWINEDKTGVRLTQRVIAPERMTGRAGFRTVSTAVVTIAPALAPAVIDVIEIGVGILAAPEVLAVAGTVAAIALGIAIYDAVAVPGNVSSQRLGQSGRLSPDQPDLTGWGFGPGSVLGDWIYDYVNFTVLHNSEDGEVTNGKKPPRDRIGEASLPEEGEKRYVPPKNYKPAMPLPRGEGGRGFVDINGDTWVKGPNHHFPGNGKTFEWDVQDSKTGGHINVDPVTGNVK